MSEDTTHSDDDEKRRGGLDGWVRLFETLSPAALEHLPELTTDDVRFRDPFNDARGRAAVRAVLEHTLVGCADLRFTITHRLFASDLALLRWRFEATIRVIGRLDVIGTCEVRQAPDGRVTQHIDHWDSGEHLCVRLPLLGLPLRAIRRRLGAGSERATSWPDRHC